MRADSPSRQGWCAWAILFAGLYVLYAVPSTLRAGVAGDFADTGIMLDIKDKRTGLAQTTTAGEPQPGTKLTRAERNRQRLLIDPDKLRLAISRMLDEQKFKLIKTRNDRELSQVSRVYLLDLNIGFLSFYRSASGVYCAKAVVTGSIINGLTGEKIKEGFHSSEDRVFAKTCFVSKFERKRGEWEDILIQAASKRLVDNVVEYMPIKPIIATGSATSARKSALGMWYTEPIPLPDSVQRIISVAVPDPDVYEGSLKNASPVLGDALRSALVEAKLFDVPSRNDMQKILKEQGFQRSSCSDDACLVEMGRAMATEKIIGSTLGKLGETYALSLRLIDLESTKIISTATGEVQDVNDLPQAMQNLGRRLVSKYLSGLQKPGP